MGKNKTSAIFYRRGIPNNNYGFGGAVLGNYSIVEPTSLFFRFPRQSFTRPPTPVFGKPTINFPLLYGAPSTSYSQSSPGPYNTIVNDQYYLDMPGGVTMSWGAAGEYNVYNQLQYNYGTATVKVNVSNVQGNVYIFRKAFDSGGNFIASYFVTQPLINGVNTFIVSSVYGAGVAIEQLGIFVRSNQFVTDPHSTCNILGANITYS